MIGIFNSIKINGEEFLRPSDFTIEKEQIYAGEYETCTGKRVGDLVGWRYADLTLEWDTLPESKLETLLAISGETEMEFTGPGQETITETVIPSVASNTATRMTGEDGKPLWKGIQLQVRFINAHN